MKRVAQIVAAGVTIAVGAVVGFKLATDVELREKIAGSARRVVAQSRERVDEMSEEVALKTAKLTRNPQVNQQWVERQWEHIGY